MAAQVEVEEGPSEAVELDVPPMPKLDVPVPIPDEKDPDEDEPVVEKDMGQLYREVGAATVERIVGGRYDWRDAALPVKARRRL